VGDDSCSGGDVEEGEDGEEGVRDAGGVKTTTFVVVVSATVASAGDRRHGVGRAGGMTIAALVVGVLLMTGAGVGAVCPKAVVWPFRRETSSSAECC
jgi:hypothetical protein